MAFLRHARLVVGLVSLASVTTAACVQQAARAKKDGGGEVFEDDPSGTTLQPPRKPDYTNPDSSAFDIAERKANGAGGGRGTLEDVDAAAYPQCAGTLKAGDLRIVEIMISSIVGEKDSGEWVEVQSTRKDCRLNVKNVRVESPRGTTGIDGATLPSTDVLLRPYGTFVVTGSYQADASATRKLPGLVFSWDEVDVLKNGGDTVNVLVGSTVLDTVTFPSRSRDNIGISISFPTECDWGDRDDFTNWSYSINPWQPPLKGTPNAPNTDVGCK